LSRTIHFWQSCISDIRTRCCIKSSEVAHNNGPCDLANRPTEKYTLEDAEHKEYHGIGVPGKRANVSLKRLEKETGKKYSIKQRIKYSDRNKAFKSEAGSLQGKQLKVDVYNKINSPGKKLL
jgi:hypothetical protein